MKMLGLVGSPRKNGNSFCLVNEALKGAVEAAPSLETEIVQLADLRIESCLACESCAQEPYECVQEDDFKLVSEKMKDSHAILIACPRYGPGGASSSKMQALLERLVNVSYLPTRNNPEFVMPLRDKPCGLLAVSVEGRQNNLPVLHSLEQYALGYGMRVIHASEWPWVGVSGRGNKKGDVLQDAEAMKNARQLGRLLVASQQK